MTSAEWAGDWVEQTVESAIRAEGEWAEMFLRANHADHAKHEIVRMRDPDENGIRWMFLVDRGAELPEPGPDWCRQMLLAWPAAACSVVPVSFTKPNLEAQR